MPERGQEQELGPSKELPGAGLFPDLDQKELGELDQGSKPDRIRIPQGLPEHVPLPHQWNDLDHIKIRSIERYYCFICGSPLAVE